MGPLKPIVLLLLLLLLDADPSNMPSIAKPRDERKLRKRHESLRIHFMWLGHMSERGCVEHLRRRSRRTRDDGSLKFMTLRNGSGCREVPTTALDCSS